MDKFAYRQLVKIAERAEKVYAELGMQAPKRIDLLMVLMDLENAQKDIPMDLNALLEADMGNFTHDVGGIVRHMDRRTGLLQNSETASLRDSRCGKPNGTRPKRGITKEGT